MQVEWKDGSTNWLPLKDLKESNPVELAEYAVANKLVEEPAFAWWDRPVLRRRADPEESEVTLLVKDP